MRPKTNTIAHGTAKQAVFDGWKAGLSAKEVAVKTGIKLNTIFHAATGLGIKLRPVKGVSK